MFFLLPLEYKHGRQTRVPPIANTILIVSNVILFGLGWSWTVGPGSGIASVFMYGFSHVSFWHLLINMWFLWVFGNPVNRRLGNGYYLLGYLGTILVMGVLARLFLHGCLAGSSGAVCTVITIALLLMPAAIMEVAYVIFFPLTILLGLLRVPKLWLHWFVNWGTVSVRAVWCLVLIPLIELCSLFWSGWNWGNAAHLFGMLCGVVIVLMLPSRISMPGHSTVGSV